MTILVAYGSIEGQTEKIARHIAARLGERGKDAVLFNTREPNRAPPESYDAAILCAPIHIGVYPKRFRKFVKASLATLNSVPSAFVSVSLAVISEHEDERHEAEGYAEKLTENTGWQPGMVHHAAGALKYLEYDFFKRWIMRRISKKEGGPVDTSQDYEFTDWDALNAFIDEFVSD